MTNFCAESGLDRKMARSCFESLTAIGQGELAKGRKFVIPGMARFVVKKKAATKAREGAFYFVILSICVFHLSRQILLCEMFSTPTVFKYVDVHNPFFNFLFLHQIRHQPLHQGALRLQG